MSDYQKAYDALADEITTGGTLEKITAAMCAELNIHSGCPLVQNVRGFVARKLFNAGSGQFIPPQNPDQIVDTPTFE